MKKCLPIMATTLEESVALAKEADAKACDMIEWRIDSLEERCRPIEFQHAWEKFKRMTDKPIIVTLRTSYQGGKTNISISEYNKSIRRIMDLIDPEYLDIDIISCGGDSTAKMFTRMAKSRGIKTIVSYHDVQYTTNARDIEMMLCRLKYIGADIPKVAYTANSMEDVSAVKYGAFKAHTQVGELIAIAMGPLGKETRLNGDEFGSIISFAKPIGSGYAGSDDVGQIELEEY